MIGIYFSGTGNTKYCIEQFVSEIDSAASCVSIEDASVVTKIQNNEQIVLAYPIYFSNLPKIMHDFIENNQNAFKGKQVFIIATMGLFSGDGTGCAARLLKKGGAQIIGGLHLKMPDCIGDEKALKKTLSQNRTLVKDAQQKIHVAASQFKDNKPTQQGLGFLYHMAGLFGQRLWFYNKTKHYSNKLKIDQNKCIGCGQCVQLCPLDNIEIINGLAQPKGRCTMCYRCVNNCPKQAITLLGNKITEQCRIEKYID